MPVSYTHLDVYKRQMLGIGPGDIKLKELMQRLQSDVEEVIIATNSSLEGETTAMYISCLLYTSRCV